MEKNKSEGKKRAGQKFKNIFLNLDLFREQFLIRLDYEGNFRNRTALGSIFSIVMFFLLLLYLGQKVKLLDSNKKVDI